MMADVAADMGGVDALSPGDAILLAEACRLLMSRPRKHVDRVRAINAANRIVEALRERRAPKRAPSDPWLVELLDPASPPAGEQNERAGERPCVSGEPFEGEGEEPLRRRIERARIGDVVRIGNVEVEIIADDDESAE